MKKSNDEWDERKKGKYEATRSFSNYPSSNEGELKPKSYKKKGQRKKSSRCKKLNIRFDVRSHPKYRRRILGKYVGAYDTSNSIFCQGNQGNGSSSIGSSSNPNKGEDERQKKCHDPKSHL